MTINELEKRLRKDKVRSDMYSFDEELANEAYCLNCNSISGAWEMYYSERGQKTWLKTLENEEIACEMFYNWIMANAG
jgi:hypothetical protein